MIFLGFFSFFLTLFILGVLLGALNQENRRRQDLDRPNVVILFRRDTPDNWSRINPVLAQDELGFETHTHYVKLGDGRTPWRDLPYRGSLPQPHFVLPCQRPVWGRQHLEES